MEVAVAAGDTQQLIDDLDAGDDIPYLVECLSGRCRLVHDREEAERGHGDIVYSGDRLKVSRLRGDALWVYAETDTRLNVSRAAADASFQERTDEMTVGNVRSIESQPAVEGLLEQAISLLEEIEENTQ